MGLNIKKIKIDDIKPASYNPRKIQEKDFKKLAKSIETFGLVDPIIINLKSNNIIGGHQRFDYLYRENKDTELHLLELGDIGWVFSDTDLSVEDEQHEKALNLALNRISGEWQYDELNVLLDELADFKLDDLTGFDYNLDEIDYEFIPLDDDEYDDDFEEDSDEIVKDYDEPVEEVTQNIIEKPKVNNTIQKNTFYKNLNNIIYYGEETDENITNLLQQKSETKKYNLKNLKHIKTLNTPVHYYITDDENTIKKIIADPLTHKL